MYNQPPPNQQGYTQNNSGYNPNQQFSQPSNYGQPTQYGQPPMYNQQHMYGQQPIYQQPIFHQNTAAQTLTISAEVFEKLPKNVRDWQIVHTVAWLEDLFSGADSLPGYVEEFRKNGVKGLDLLAIGESSQSESQIFTLGITLPLHVGRMKACISQLVLHQRRNDEEALEDKVMQKEEQAYFEMEKRYEELSRQVPPYELPPKMSKWTPVDVFMFIKLPEHQELLGMFTKPLAMNKIDGKELIELAKERKAVVPELVVEDVSTNEKKKKKETAPVVEEKPKLSIDLAGLEANERDITRFRSAVNEFRRRQDDHIRSLKEEADRELKQHMQKFDSSKVNTRVKIGSGAFGVVYLAEYERKQVVVKQLLGGDSVKGRQENDFDSEFKRGDLDSTDNEKELLEAHERVKQVASVLQGSLTITTALWKKLPFNVKKWTTDEAVLWLEDVFANADALTGYAEKFKSNGVNGLDILALGDTQLQQLGITSPLHVGRVKAAVAQLNQYQRRIDEESKKETSVARKEVKTSRKHITNKELMDHEACMLQRAAGTGIVILKAVDVTSETEPPCMMTEFLCKKSLEHELQEADRNNADSIFHPYNEKNQYEKNTNRVEDPVLLQMVRIARDVAAALAHIHSKGILHLDIAARNILLDGSKRPKIADFGGAVMEKDMADQFEFRKKLIEKYGKRSTFSKDYEYEVAEETKHEDDFAMKAHMHMHRRAIKWMPDSFFDCGNPRNPLLDQSVDIYSFGCLMYELATHKAPHHDVSDEEVKRYKRSRKGNPSVPPGLDPRYAEIMTTCWAAKEKQLPMAEVSAQLVKLHMMVMTASYEKEDNNKYINLRDLLHGSAISAQTQLTASYATTYTSLAESYANPSAGSAGYSSVGGSGYSNLSEAEGTVNKNAEEWRNYTDQRPSSSFPAIKPGRIRFLFPAFLNVNDVEKIAEYETMGMVREDFETALRSSLRFRDHDTIALYMQCIRLENDPVQIRMITICLQYLAQLADDENGYTDKAVVWQSLCVAVLRVVFAAKHFQSATAVDGLDALHQAEVLHHALAAIAALLRRKTISDAGGTVNSHEVTMPAFHQDLCEVVTSALRQYPEDEQVVENAAVAVASLVTMSPLILEKLHMGGIVGALVDAMRVHRRHNNTALGCIKALSCFPIQKLIDPRANTSTSFNPAGMNASSPLFGACQSGKPVQDILSPAEYRAHLWGEVFEGIFSIVKSRAEQKEEDRPSSTGHKEPVDKVTLLEAALQALFRTCDAGIYDMDLTERFLYTVLPSDITTLHAIVAEYADHFRIQEGAIGLLAYMMNSGYPQQFEDFSQASSKVKTGTSNKLSQHGNYELQLVEVPLATNAKTRLATLLAVDPSLKLLLSAMEKFSTNDRIATGIEEADHSDFHREATMTQGVVNTVSRSATNTMSMTVTRAGATATHQQSRYASATMNRTPKAVYEDNDEVSNFARDFLEKLDENVLETDAEGEQISAASLQKSVAMIVGIACTCNPEVQDNLLRTRYNELILLAFKNFQSDVNLIRYGCYALFSTCRRNAKHQKMLHELNVFKLLQAALKEHKSLWTVTDGVICAIIGLLEPAMDVGNMSLIKEILAADAAEKAAKTIHSVAAASGLLSDEEKFRQQTLKRAASDRRGVFDGYRVALEVTKVDKTTDWEEKVTETPSLIQNLAVVIAIFQINPDCHPLVCNYLKLLSAVTFWLPNLLDSWNDFFVDLESDERLSKIMKMFKQRTKTMNDKKTKTANNTSITTTTTTTLAANDSAEKEGEKEKEKGKKVVTSEDAMDGQDFKKFDLKVCTIIQFVQLSLMWHSHQPFVLAAGLGVITAVIREGFVDLPVGAQLPFGESVHLYRHRQRAVEYGIVKLCLEAAKRREDNPILIRYSLWLLLFFISQPKSVSNIMAAFDETKNAHTAVRRENVHVTSAVKENTSADAIAADIAISGGIEWAITVAKRYGNYYSLQALASLFLIWMEHHGRFSNRDEGRLRELKQVLQKNLNRRSDSFLALDAEGHDTYLMGQTVDMFGQLSLHANRLIRLIDSHLPQEEDDAVEPWDGICRPLSITVTSVETEEDPRTLTPCSVFELTVQWDKVKKWRVAHRFRLFLELKKQLEHEFVHLAPISQSPLSKATFSKLVKIHSQKFLQTRRDEIQKWLSEVASCRATLFSPHMIAFLQMQENSAVIRSVKMLPQLHNSPGDTPQFPVHSVVYDLVSGIVVVGSGVVKSSIFFVSKTQTRGVLSVYRVSSRSAASSIDADGEKNDEMPCCWANGSHKLTRMATQLFNVGVASVAWERSRRQLIVGLSTGAILFYYLDESCTKLTYCSEHDYHSGMLCNMIVEPTNNVFIGTAQQGTMSVFNMNEGAVSTQCAKEDAQFTAVAYDRTEHIAFCGTRHFGTVRAFDLYTNPPRLLRSFILPHDKLSGKGDVNGVVFVEETRLLYATHFNNIHIYKVAPKATISKSEKLMTLSMRDNIRICNLLVFNRGYYVVASGTKGVVALFDISDPPKEETVEEAIANASRSLSTTRISHAKSVMSSSASDINALSTTTSTLIEWSEVIQRSNSAMRDWLRANGVDSSMTVTRPDLIRLVQAYQQQKQSEPVVVAEFLIPKTKRVDAFLTWNLNPIPLELLEQQDESEKERATMAEAAAAAAAAEGPPPKGTKSLFVEVPFIRCSAYIEEMRTIAFGCDNGVTHFVSLADFIPPLSKGERQDVAHMRTQLAYADTSPQGIKGSVKSSKGKRHQL